MSWQLLCQCLSSYVCQRGCFSNCIQNPKLVVFAVYIAPFLSQSNKALQGFQILVSLVNRTLFPWCLWKFCSRVDFMSAFIPAETTKRGVCIGNSMICSDIWHKYHWRYFEIVIRNFTSRYASEIWDNFEISQVVFMPNITYKSCYYLFILLATKVL